MIGRASRHRRHGARQRTAQPPARAVFQSSVEILATGKELLAAAAQQPDAIFVLDHNLPDLPGKR